MTKYERVIEALREQRYRLTPQRLLVLATEVAISDRLHYELTDPDGAHHHMVCQVCNGAYNLSPRYLDELRDILIREFGFEPDLDHFAITGVCANCRGVDSTQDG